MRQRTARREAAILFAIRAIWLGQAVVLFGGGTAFVVESGLVGHLFEEVDGHIELQLVELFAPLAIGLGALTLQILRPSFGWLRESLSSAFFLSWLIALVILSLNGAPLAVTGAAAMFALFNLGHGWYGEDSETPPSARPSASDEAPLLGRVWAVQMYYYVVCGALVLMDPHGVVEALFAGAQALDAEPKILAVAAPLYFAMGILSHHAIGAQTDETWRGYCQAFMYAQLLTAGAMAYSVFTAGGGGPGEVALTPWQVVVIVPSLLLGFVNLMTLRDRRWIRRSLGRLRDLLDIAWTVQGVLLFLLMLGTWAASEWVLEPFFLATGLAEVSAYGPPIEPAGTLDGFVGGAGAALDRLTPSIGPISADQRELAVDAYRLMGPLNLALVALTFVALLRRRRLARYHFARIFSAWGVLSVIVVLTADPFILPNDSVLTMPVVMVMVALAFLIAVINLTVWLFPDWESSDEQYRGAADTKPRWVYRLCVAQAVFFGSLVVLAAAFPSWTVHLILQVDPGAVHPLASNTVRATAPVWAVMAVMSAYTAASANEWSWRGQMRWFALWQGAYVVTFVYCFDSDLYEQSVLLWPTIVAGLAVLNAWASAIPLHADQLAGQPRPAGWLASDTGPGLPLVLSTLRRRRRPYHRVGVGATGRFEPDLAKMLPNTPFFAERDHPMLATIRFSNKREADDAALDIRGCGLRLSWPDTDQPLDLLFATGAYSISGNVVQAIYERVAWRGLRERLMRKSYPLREAVIAGQRRAPESYSKLEYHTQLVRLWIGINQHGETTGRRCRLRLVPELGPDEPESGLPSEADEEAPWDTARRADEQRTPDYLRKELAERLADGEVRLKLQAQVGPWGAHAGWAIDDDSIWYDARVDWDPTSFPWYDVGTVVLDRVLPDEATDLLRFDPGLGGGVIATPRSGHWRDERSLAAAQVRVIRHVGNLRLTLSRLLGGKRS